MPKFTLNKERARDVARTAVSMLESKCHPFNLPDVFPDTIVSGGIAPGSVEHAFLIFYACSLDSMRRANDVYKALREISLEVQLSGLFANSQEKVEELVYKHFEKPTQKGKPTLGNPAAALCVNSMKLYQEYNNNPVSVARKTIDDTLKELDRFKGVGLGKAALIMKNFVRFNFWGFSPYEIPVKVDRHLIRISLGTGIIEAREQVLSHDVIEPLTQCFRDVTAEERISAVSLDDALWGIGSRLCLQNNHTYCKTACSLNCSTRPVSDSYAYLFQPGTDKRKGHKHQQILFS